MSTISGVSGSSNAWAALNTQRSQHQAKMFAKVDADSSGSVDQAELGTLLSDISEKTGASLGDAKELFTQMDSNSDGSLSSDELDSGMQALMQPPPSTMEFAQSRGMGGGLGGEDDLFAKVDTDSDGSVSKDELKVLTDKIQEDTGQDLSEDFAKLDTDSDGQLSQTEFEAGRPQPPEGSQGAQGPGGPGGPRGPGGPGGAQGAASSDTTYDALDTNQDGTVSEVERMVGELKEALAGLSSSDEASNTATNQQIAELAQKIYAQVAQSLSETSDRSLSVTA
jgi:Ca2+-binding EF-hand superfamily protein